MGAILLNKRFLLWLDPVAAAALIDDFLLVERSSKQQLINLDEKKLAIQSLKLMPTSSLLSTVSDRKPKFVAPNIGARIAGSLVIRRNNPPFHFDADLLLFITCLFLSPKVYTQKAGIY